MAKGTEDQSPVAGALWQQALDTAAGSVRVRTSGMNRIVDVSCDSTSPQMAADFCNTLAHEYIEQNLESRWAATEHTGAWLTNQLRDLKIKLEKSEEELQAYARQTGLVYTGEKNDAQETILADLAEGTIVGARPIASPSSRSTRWLPPARPERSRTRWTTSR